MNSIQEQWNSFETLVVPKNAHAVQRNQMRRAFYAGASAMMRIQWEIGDKKINEDAGVAILKGCCDEVRRFALQVQNGGA